jgi:hypothetical protein
MSVPSSEVGLPSPASECVPPTEPRMGAHSPAGEGVGESQFGRLEKKPSALSTLCIKSLVFSRLPNYIFSQAPSFGFPFRTLEAKLCKISRIFIESRI